MKRSFAADRPPRIDSAFLDYRWRSWLGLRTGIIDMPFGLYNEYVDIDAARLPILLPGGVYPIRDRDVLPSHTISTITGCGSSKRTSWMRPRACR